MLPYRSTSTATPSLLVNTTCGRCVRGISWCAWRDCSAKHRAEPRGLNFVQLMLKLARERGEVRVVESEWLCPTHTLDAAEQLLVLTSSGRPGLYHMVSGEGCSWHASAKANFELTGTQVKLSVAGPNEFPSKVLRPTDSRLHNAALIAAGLNQMPHWLNGLNRYLNLI